MLHVLGTLALAASGCQLDAGRTYLPLEGLTVIVEESGLSIGADVPDGTGARALEPLTISQAGVRWRVMGTRIERCEGESCETVVEVGADFTHVVSGERGWILGMLGKSPGLYRVVPWSSGDLRPLALGELLALCEVDGHAWAVTRHGVAERLVVASPETPAVSQLGPVDVFLAAVGDRPRKLSVEVLTAWLMAAAEGRWLERASMAARVSSDPRPEVRRAAVETLRFTEGSVTMATLYLLAHDDVPAVRQQTLWMARSWCRDEPSLPCDVVLGMFLDGPQDDVTWAARDALLPEYPTLALTDAPPKYKLDAVSSLAYRLQNDGDQRYTEALRLLLRDDDPEVRHAAGVVAGRLSP